MESHHADIACIDMQHVDSKYIYTIRVVLYICKEYDYEAGDRE